MASGLNLSLRYKGYIPGLDVLRGLAILLVIFYHGTEGRVPWQGTTTWLRWPLLAAQYGASGVELFFVLSGFLITSILIDTAADKDYYRHFYIRRALRILPGYLLLLVVLKLDHVISWRFVLAALLYIANMASLVGAKSYEYGALWSLAVEEQFYLIWPVIVRRLSLKALTRSILGYLLFVFVFRLVCLLFFPGADVLHKLWTNAESLLVGALISICLRRDLLRRDNIARVGWSLAGVAALLWPLTLFLDLRWGNGGADAVWVRFLRSVTPYGLLATYGALLLLVIAFNQEPSATSGQSIVARFLSFFGYISYGLYLVHQLIFNTFDRWVQGTMLDPQRGPGWGLWLNALICTLVATGIAWLSRRYFEALFLRRKDRIVPYKNPAVDEKPVTEGV